MGCGQCCQWGAPSRYVRLIILFSERFSREYGHGTLHQHTDYPILHLYASTSDKRSYESRQSRSNTVMARANAPLYSRPGPRPPAALRGCAFRRRAHFHRRAACSATSAVHPATGDPSWSSSTSVVGIFYSVLQRLAILQ